MKIPLNPVIEAVSVAYKFNIEYCDVLDRWRIKGKLRHAVEFYWDSSYSYENFFDELNSSFNEEGRESVYPY